MKLTLDQINQIFKALENKDTRLECWDLGRLDTICKAIPGGYIHQYHNGSQKHEAGDTLSEFLKMNTASYVLVTETRVDL